ncbi:BON domain-containing protein [Simplicispira psychrophila]|uniref:BON domain-containing protein n=1 Tax=Simplicispira psychrophila TaxID=80882 RepID=UPI0004875DE7|nr:BON domain-containing protein [Simplicispira psychrophila]
MLKKTVLHRPNVRIVGWLAVSALALGLAACDKMKEPTAGERLDSAVDKTQRAAENAKVDAERALSSAQTKTEAVAHDAAQAAREAGNSSMELMDDVSITARVSAGLAQDSALSALRIDVDTSNGVVTLKGPAPTQEAKDRASSIAQGVKGVSSVVNQLTVQAS